VPQCDRDAGVGGYGDGRSDAGHDLEGHAGGDQRGRLLAAAGEHEGIATLEPHHRLPTAPALDQQVVDLGLRQAHVPRRLADVDALGGGGCQIEQRLLRQSVVDDDVGPAQ
jgi:hypothetical protein